MMRRTTFHLTPATCAYLDKIARSPATWPFCAYIYDLPALASHARWMKETLPDFCELFYAVKANAEAQLLDTLGPICDGFEVASGGELSWVARHQPHTRLLFGGPGKLDSELTMALDHAVEAIHVESLNEMRRLDAIARKTRRKAPVMLRLNLTHRGANATRLVMSGGPSQFGMDEADLPEAARFLSESNALHLQGVHVHVQSHQCDVRSHLRMIEDFLDQIRKIEARYRLHIPIVNCGGGMGISYQDPHGSFDWQYFSDRLHALARENIFGGKTLRFEVGRFITASCGTYVMEVLDIKKSHGEWFAIARGGTHHFRLPAAQAHDHPVIVVRRGGSPAIVHQPVTFCGQLCTPKDVLSRRQMVAALAPGDLLAFPLAGAYAWTISHRDFLMHAPPEHIFLGAP